MSNKRSSYNPISQELEELHNIVTIITNSTDIAIEFSNTDDTASYDFEKRKITLTYNYFPKGLENFPIILKKCTDGSLVHEAGHALLTQPYYERYKRWIRSKHNPKLAQIVFNILEDVRIDAFLMRRYRFDFGLRRKLLLDILKDTWKPLAQAKVETSTAFKIPKISKILGAICQIGKFKGDFDETIKGLQMGREEIEDTKAIVELLEQAQYARVALKLVRLCDSIYNILSKYETHISSNQLIILLPAEIAGKGGVRGAVIKGGNIEKKLEGMEQAEVERRKAEEQEKEAAKQEELRKGGVFAGKDKGERIPAPEPNFAKYEQLVQRNYPEIQRLLRKLKMDLIPIREIEKFQRRGRVMPNLLSKAYVSSFRKPVNNIHKFANIRLEKRPVAMSILVDFSGSMSRWVAENVLTVLGEVFGKWVEDIAYSILVFGADHQKVKSNFEQYHNTRARIGNITVNSSATMVANALADVHRMLAGIDYKRTRICVIASDFYIHDNSEAKKIIESMNRQGIKVIAVGLCSGDIYRAQAFSEHATYVANVHELPEKFIEIYKEAVK